MKNEKTPPSDQEQFVLDALAEIRNLVFYKLSPFHRDSVDDLLHRIFCKLWSWKTRHNKTLECQEWRKLIRTIAYREISEYFSEKYTKDLVFSQLNPGFEEALLAMATSRMFLEGNTKAEIDSLLCSVWKAAQVLTLRQRYAFILHSDCFLIEFISTGNCKIAELAAYFEVTEENLLDLLNFIPLSDEQIGQLLAVKLNESLSSKQIWQARAKAKARLSGFLKRPTRNEKLFAGNGGKTFVGENPPRKTAG